MVTINTSTKNTLPGPGASFNDDLQTFLAEEDAERYADIFSDIIVSGGIFSAASGLTQTPSELTAYPTGFYINETGSITFNDDDTTWVAAYKDTATTSFIGGWTRVSGTHYIIESISSTQPTIPTGAIILMKVVTASGSVSTVTDLRAVTPFSNHLSDVFHFAGNAVDETVIVDKFRFRTDATIDKILITAQTAPTGAALTIDITKDTVEQSTLATLAISAKQQLTTLSVQASFTSVQDFGLKFKSIGSSVAGADIMVVVYYTGGTSLADQEAIADNADVVAEAVNRASGNAALAASSSQIAKVAQVAAAASAAEAATVAQYESNIQTNATRAIVENTFKRTVTAANAVLDPIGMQVFT